MTLELTPVAIGFALMLFGLRVFNYAISTIRLVLIARGQKFWSSIIAFMEALIFAAVIAQVVSDLTNIINLMAYCLGAAVGSYLGMWIEARFVTSYSTVTIITQEMGQEIAESLRENSFGVTVTKGEGRDGNVDIIRSSVITRDLPSLVRIVHKIYGEAFIDVESARNLYRGWLPGGPPRRG